MCFNTKSYPNMSNKKGAIVFGSDAQAVGIARALGKHKIPVIAFSWELGIARFSRYVNKVIRVPHPRKVTSFITSVQKHIQKYNLFGWIAYPTDDDSVSVIANHNSKLVLTTWGIDKIYHRKITDKFYFSHFASQLGIKTPRTLMYSDIDSSVKLDYPVVLKPRVKEPFVRVTRKKAIRVSSSRQLHETVKKLSVIVPVEHLAVQEFIPGKGKGQLSYTALMIDGRPLSEYTACRIRQHPMEFGRASTYVRPINNTEAIIAGRKILSSINYTGVAEVEFKQNLLNNSLYVLDVNPRTWGWHTLILSSKGNWLYYLHEFLSGKKPKIIDNNNDHCWAKLITDIPTVFSEILKHNMTFSDWYNDYFRNKLCYCTWNKNDYLPFFAEIILSFYLLMKRGY